jgi:hypothetical protein
VQSVTFLHKSYAASDWSAEISGNGVVIFHQLGLASSHAAAITLQVQSEIAADRRAIPQIFKTSASSFNFDFIEASTATAIAFMPVSVNVHIQVMV